MESIADETKLCDEIFSTLQFNSPEQADYDYVSNNERPNHKMKRIHQLLDRQPQLQKVCENSINEFYSSNFKTYKFHNEQVDDLKYIITFCGDNLTRLDLTGYSSSDIMPLIKSNCPDIEQLELCFKEIKDEHFDNVFFNMSHLETLMIKWEGGNKTIPITLVNSLKQVGGTLKIFWLLNDKIMSKKNCPCLPNELAEVFSELTALENLLIHNFDQNQSLIESIGEMKKLADFSLSCDALMEDPKFNKKYNMYPIGNLKNLESLSIDMDYGVTDEFLINLSNNAKKLKHLYIVGTNITDTGMIAISRLKKLTDLFLGLDDYKKINKFITDESVSCLMSKKLSKLDLTNCINITNISVIKLIKNLLELNCLYIENTSVNYDIVSKVDECVTYRKVSLFVYVSFINPGDKLLKTSHNVIFRFPTENSIK